MEHNNDSRQIFLNIRTTFENTAGMGEPEVQADDKFYMLACNVDGGNRVAFGINKSGGIAFAKATVKLIDNNADETDALCMQVVENNGQITYTINNGRAVFQTVIPLKGETYADNDRLVFEETKAFVSAVTGVAEKLRCGRQIDIEYSEYKKKQPAKEKTSEDSGPAEIKPDICTGGNGQDGRTDVHDTGADMATAGGTKTISDEEMVGMVSVADFMAQDSEKTDMDGIVSIDDMDISAGTDGGMPAMPADDDIYGIGSGQDDADEGFVGIVRDSGGDGESAPETKAPDDEIKNGDMTEKDGRKANPPAADTEKEKSEKPNSGIHEKGDGTGLVKHDDVARTDAPKAQRPSMPGGVKDGKKDRKDDRQREYGRNKKDIPVAAVPEMDFSNISVPAEKLDKGDDIRRDSDVQKREERKEKGNGGKKPNIPEVKDRDHIQAVPGDKLSDIPGSIKNADADGIPVKDNVASDIPPVNAEPTPETDAKNNSFVEKDGMRKDDTAGKRQEQSVAEKIRDNERFSAVKQKPERKQDDARNMREAQPASANEKNRDGQQAGRTDGNEKRQESGRKGEEKQYQGYRGNVFANYERDLRNLENRYRNQFRNMSFDDITGIIESRYGEIRDNNGNLMEMPDYIRENICNIAKSELKNRMK